MVHRNAEASSDDQEFQSFDEEIDAAAEDELMALADGAEEEFHTEDESEESGESESDEEDESRDALKLASDGDGALVDGTVSDEEETAAAAPLLPPELLNAAPRALASTHLTFDPSTEQLTRRQKTALRSRSRQAKKRTFDRLRRDSAGTGVLEAGQVAQLKRGVAAAKGLQAGRVSKSRAPKTSGRHKMLLERQREVELRHKTFARSSEERRARKGKKSRG